MPSLSLVVAFLVRLVLVLLFLPFSALDKILNFRGAVGQAQEAVASRGAAAALICAGLVVEVVMSLGVLTGIADRAAAFVLAGYCAVTALLWKQFWKPATSGTGLRAGAAPVLGLLEEPRADRRLFLITFGTGADGVARFLDAPLASSNPYRITGSSHDRRQPANPLLAPVDRRGRHQPPVALPHDRVRAQVDVAAGRAAMAGAEDPRGGHGVRDRAAGRLDRRLAREPEAAVDHPALRPLVRRGDGRDPVEMGPGEISFGEDQNTRETDGRKGHYSGTVGDEPCVLMIVQFDAAPTLAAACRFR